MTNAITGNGQWQIYTGAVQIPKTDIIIGTAYHNYVALVDPTGKVVAELNGTFSGNDFTANATPGNYLVANIGPVGSASLVASGNPVVFTQPVFSGTQEQMSSLFYGTASIIQSSLSSTSMLYAGYPPVGTAINSNSVWATFFSLNGLSQSQITALEPPGWLNVSPGDNINLLTQPSNNTALPSGTSFAKIDTFQNGLVINEASGGIIVTSTSTQGLNSYYSFSPPAGDSSLAFTSNAAGQPILNIGSLQLVPGAGNWVDVNPSYAPDP